MYWPYSYWWQEPHFSARDSFVSGVWASCGLLLWHVVQSWKR